MWLKNTYPKCSLISSLLLDGGQKANKQANEQDKENREEQEGLVLPFQNCFFKNVLCLIIFLLKCQLSSSTSLPILLKLLLLLLLRIARAAFQQTVHKAVYIGNKKQTRKWKNGLPDPSGTQVTLAKHVSLPTLCTSLFHISYTDKHPIIKIKRG